ncbi:MAG TPA: plasmid pRiA4b ORF-3 family protein [Tepidisphaeraceae bacterium]|nr:plasmid pRiA4b ORF-3 family protein [Tepidisphaeraceae bacterium]
MGTHLGRYLLEQLTLKITLAGSDPKIWRRVEVHSGLTLHDLHHVIQRVFDWTDSHLYHFLVPPGGKLTRAALRDAKRYHVLPPDPIFGDEEASESPADEALIGRIFTPECKQIIYEYDFGDSWEHLVKLEKRSPRGDPGGVPRCLAGQNAAPRDDMGGIPGYYRYVQALRDATHEMHDEASDWLGQDFDPALRWRWDLRSPGFRGGMGRLTAQHRHRRRRPSRGMLPAQKGSARGGTLPPAPPAASSARQRSSR